MVTLFIILIGVILAIVCGNLFIHCSWKVFNFPKDVKKLRTLKMVKLGQKGVVLPVRISGITSKRDTIYSGLGKEPKWQGKLPEAVTDYVKPRYVYEDLAETECITLEHGFIVGYRISPTLVISSMVGTNYHENEIQDFIDEFGGNFLNKEDVNVLRDNYKQLSELRKMAGDTELPSGFFWIKSEENKMIVAHHSLPIEGKAIRDANIILKR